MSLAEFTAAARGLSRIENLLCFASVGSTSTLMRQLLESYLSDETRLPTTCALALEQTEGRGRGVRRWHSAGGKGLYFTLVRAMDEGEPLELLPLLAGASLAGSLRDGFGVEARLKWPNDVLVGGRKIAGILVEAVTRGSEGSYAFVGVGLNVAQRREDFPADLADRATSLWQESGAEPPLAAVFGRIVTALDADLALLADPPAVIGAWRASTVHRPGDHLRITTGLGSAEGQYIDIDAEGRLNLAAAGGERITMGAGEIVEELA